MGNLFQIPLSWDLLLEFHVRLVGVEIPKSIFKSIYKMILMSNEVWNPLGKYLHVLLFQNLCPLNYLDMKSGRPPWVTEMSGKAGHLMETGSSVGSCPEAARNSGLWAFKQRCCSVICEKTSLWPPHRITGWRGRLQAKVLITLLMKWGKNWRRNIWFLWCHICTLGIGRGLVISFAYLCLI